MWWRSPIAASTRNGARQCYFLLIVSLSTVVSYQLLSTCRCPAPRGSGTAEPGLQGTAGIPSCGNHVLTESGDKDATFGGGILRYITCLPIWEQAPGFCKRPGNACRQGAFFSQNQHLRTRHRRGEGESSPPCPPNACCCCCHWLPVVLTHLTKLQQNLG